VTKPAAPAAVYVVEIDQAAIDAPDFPRDAAWWRRYLPAWFYVERTWALTDTERQAADETGVTIGDTGHVVIAATTHRRAADALAWITQGALGKRLAAGGAWIRQAEGATSKTPTADMLTTLGRVSAKGKVHIGLRFSGVQRITCGDGGRARPMEHTIADLTGFDGDIADVLVAHEIPGSQLCEKCFPMAVRMRYRAALRAAIETAS
jgi:hypothetical protein